MSAVTEGDPLPEEERPLKVTVTVLVPHDLMKWADDWGKRQSPAMNRGKVVTEALTELRALEEPGR